MTRILSTEEYNQLQRDLAAERNKPRLCDCHSETIDGADCFVISPSCSLHCMLTRAVPRKRS